MVDSCEHKDVTMNLRCFKPLSHVFLENVSHLNFIFIVQFIWVGLRLGNTGKRHLLVVCAALIDD